VAGYRSGSTAGKVVDDFEGQRGGYTGEEVSTAVGGWPEKLVRGDGNILPEGRS
jgi:hypothetical protein